MPAPSVMPSAAKPSPPPRGHRSANATAQQHTSLLRKHRSTNKREEQEREGQRAGLNRTLLDCEWCLPFIIRISSTLFLISPHRRRARFGPAGADAVTAFACAQPPIVGSCKKGLDPSRDQAKGQVKGKTVRVRVPARLPLPSVVQHHQGHVKVRTAVHAGQNKSVDS